LRKLTAQSPSIGQKNSPMSGCGGMPHALGQAAGDFYNSLSGKGVQIVGVDSMAK
jgi:hypothetical protein